MKRQICGFYKDDNEDWVVKLDCAHGQHARNTLPFINRPWVETEAGRAVKLGTELDCQRCDRFEMPEGLGFYHQTPEFDEVSIPPGLLKDHSTKTGTWGLIRVDEGQLQYTAGDHTETLEPGHVGVVVPNMLHSVAPNGPVRFCVEFYRE